jgi:hypothetical protein
LRPVRGKHKCVIVSGPYAAEVGKNSNFAGLSNGPTSLRSPQKLRWMRGVPKKIGPVFQLTSALPWLLSPTSCSCSSATTIRHDQDAETTGPRLRQLQIAKSKVRWPAAVLRDMSDSGAGLLLSTAPGNPGKPVCLPHRIPFRVALIGYAG